MSRPATQAMLKSETERASEPGETGSSPVIDFMSFANQNWLHWDGVSSQLEKMGFPSIINADAIVAANKEAVDALVESASTVAKGAEEIGRHALSAMQNATEANLETMKAAFQAKSPQELAEIQSQWASRVATAAFNETAKLSELSIRLSRETAASLYARFSGVCGKFAKRD